MNSLLELLNIIWGRISYLFGVPVQAFGEWAWQHTAYYLLSPELFLLAAREMDLMPRHCCVIEDSPSGVAAARAAGSACVAVTNSADAEDLTSADMVVDSLSEIGLGEIAQLIRGSGP